MNWGRQVLLRGSKFHVSIALKSFLGTLLRGGKSFCLSLSWEGKLPWEMWFLVVVRNSNNNNNNDGDGKNNDNDGDGNCGENNCKGTQCIGAQYRGMWQAVGAMERAGFQLLLC